MTTSASESKKMDEIHVMDDKKDDIQEVDDKKQENFQQVEAESEIPGKNANQSPSDTGIEVQLGDDEDPCQQIAYMVHGLSTRQKRRTLQLLQPELQPLLSSTLLDDGNETPQPHHTSGARSKDVPVKDDTLYTSTGEVTLPANTSVSKIVFQAPKPNHMKLRTFSGTDPVPKGEVDYRTWSSAAKRLKKRTDLDDEEKCEKLQNSLLKPALSLVRAALDSAQTGKVLSLLAKAYDDVKDVRDLQNEFHASLQLSNEKCSEFLTRLYLQLQEIDRRCMVEDFDGELLKQFIYGCSDDKLILTLRLEEKDESGIPPEYGSLLVSIRRQEERQLRKRDPARRARLQQISDTGGQDHAPDDSAGVAALQKEVVHLRKEVAHLKQQHAPDPAPPPTAAHTSWRQDGKPANVKTSLHFCFQCGLEGHKIWSCNNAANPTLVAQKFDMAKKQRQENKQGSK